MPGVPSWSQVPYLRNPQLCPRCSDLRQKAFGTYDCHQRRFECFYCGLVLHGEGYERALDRYLDIVWQSKQDARALDAVARELRKAMR